MTFVSKARVRETTNTTGTGNITLAGAVQDYRRFGDVMANGDTTWYLINLPGSNSWEVGVGTWNTGATLSRTTVLESTNANALVNFAAGTKDVIMVFPGSLASHTLNQIEETLSAAATVDLGSVGTRRVMITGSATISSFGTSTNQIKFVRVIGNSPDVGVTLTHSSSLLCPAETNMTLFNGDMAIVTSDASGNWRVRQVTRARNAAASDFQPSTSTLFFQAAAPIFWTKQTGHNDKAIRIVSGTGGGSGGTAAFSSVFGTTSTNAFTLTSNEIPAHTHTDSGHTHPNVGADTVCQSGTGVFRKDNSSTASASGSANNQNTGSGASHSHGIELRTQYIDIINCNKDA